MSTVDTALELLQIDPLPDDVRARLTALEKKTLVRDRWMFAQLWSGLIVKEGQEGSVEES